MLIDKFKKNSTEEVRIEIKEYRGEKYINIRVWYYARDNGKPEYQPSKRGITLNINLFEDLKKAILKTEKEIEKQLSR